MAAELLVGATAARQAVDDPSHIRLVRMLALLFAKGGG